MKNKLIKSLFLVCLMAAIVSFDLPADWFKAGSNPEKYDMGIDKGAGQDGKNAATIKSIDRKINGFGTLMQNCLPEKYLGKRVRMTGLMKTSNVSGWAGLWFRVDPNLSFDNMKDGKKDVSVTGTSDWKKYEIVLDVPTNATNLAYGALLVGNGQIWFQNLNFEIVDNSVAITGIDEKDSTHDRVGNLKEPSNLNFEK